MGQLGRHVGMAVRTISGKTASPSESALMVNNVVHSQVRAIRSDEDDDDDLSDVLLRDQDEEQVQNVFKRQRLTDVLLFFLFHPVPVSLLQST
ncbi:hypothetical protein F2P81_021513 [Scophthalmus maximus]|uniref:Uncharacterized protein n=1 Tax=Scophthalmus maximus TaxID=52904 RepID=A0A6A4RVJ5_SCOMX|nr:hypothetical protein F2P81_021513 [Scophthalmus maximus]